MLAYELTGFGGPEVLRLSSRPEPLPGPHEVVVATRAIGLNPVDLLQRSGKFRFANPARFPLVPGNEFTGVVVAAGTDVTSLSVGDAVFARTDKARLGALAEQVAIEAELVVPMPRSLDFVTAAAVPLAGTTALQAIRDALDVRQEDRLLVTGGSSTVGMFAIQLAARTGASVTTTASAGSTSLLRELGADDVINYHTQAVDSGRDRFDKVLDLVGGTSAAALSNVVARRGRLVTVSATPTPGSIRHDYTMAPWRAALLEAGLWLATLGLRRRARRGGYTYQFLSMRPSADDLRELASLIDHGALRVKVDSIYDFDQVADAFARVESRRAKGKVVVRTTE
ncbi:NADP-dependent oxidoreductase [Lentzea sp. BCCO 10_0061]|uniref:NADP-dependent oxidoreductase n=1 Tax=Lentzea sokolovensis TaxID=3095429 RepID=A0ABU4URH6_9PSEU|nr:NADP-dependent oxidoreductase [Lentzea sp. BCCO 10_0061]MDX8142093.1 NADP-dependent oxidoreductase [Lentzea sp. BCCO 10_0061]